MEEIKRLLDWYDKTRRILPWREDPSPYHIWLSEIMLQQTRVEAVKNYYERFLAALPDISSLAAAPEDLVLKLWEGLGYYSRIRNMRRGAKMVMEELGGKMPEEKELLLKIPGIGPYTASAIASIAYGRPEVAVDGNLLRIFARLCAFSGAVDTPAAKKAAEGYLRGVFLDPVFSGDDPAEPDSAAKICAGDFAARNLPGDVNQALMDLGAMVCLPNAAPKCEICPLAPFCKAHAGENETAYPVRTPKKARTVEKITVFLIRHEDGIIIRRRPAKGLLAGLYEFPNAPGHLSRQEAEAFAASLGSPALRIRPLPPAKHIFTHKEWDMRGYEIWTDPFETGEEHAGAFGAKKADIRARFALPSAFRPYAELL